MGVRHPDGDARDEDVAPKQAGAALGERSPTMQHRPSSRSMEGALLPPPARAISHNEATPTLSTAADRPPHVLPLAPPLSTLVVEGEAPLARGTMLGRYVVLDLLGSGGMGVVYAAYDPELGRKVAIKVLQAHLSETTDGRVRLMREAQALARLSHPNVVAVHDVGSVGAQIFIAMELVEGKTLGVWMREEQRPWRAVVEVFSAAGRGLAAAHAAGVIHRDFKPSNVLVSDDGRIRVMDFGLARSGGEREATVEPAPATAPAAPWVSSGSLSTSALAADLTATGSVLGTPKYLPPEAYYTASSGAAGDQFAYCAALYEALWGVPPFPLETPPNDPARWSPGEPPRLPHVPKWIARLVLRGLARDPAARHPSMHALVDAMGRDPRVRSRRALAVLGVGALAVGSWGATRVRAERAEAACQATGREIASVWSEARAAKIRAAFSSTSPAYALATWRWAAGQLDSYAQQWSATRVDVCTQARLEATMPAPLERSATACLDERRDDLHALLLQLEAPDQATVQRTATAVTMLAPPTTCADPLRLRHQSTPPSDARTHEQVRTLRALLARAASETSTAHYDRGFAAASEVAAKAAALPWPPLHLEARLAMADAAFGKGSFQEARQILEDAFYTAGATGRDEQALRAATKLVILVGHRLAFPDEGLRWGQLAQMLATRLARQDDLQVAALTSNLAVVWGVGRGEHAKAIELLERTTAMRERLLGAEHPLVAMSLSNLGLAHTDREDYERALPILQRALAIRLRSLGEAHPDTALEMSNVGSTLSALGQHAQARALLERALEVREQVLGPDHPDVADLLNKVGRARARAGSPATALPVHERALAIQRARYGEKHPVIADSLAHLARAKLELGDSRAALPLFTQALEMRLALLPASHPDVIEGHIELGKAYLALGDRRAVEQLDRALRARLGSAPADVGLVRALLARALWSAGQLPRARQEAETAKKELASVAPAKLGHREALAALTSWLAALP